MAVPHLSSVIVHDDGPLIGILIEEDDGREAVRYFTSESAADDAASAEVTEEALNLAGAWRDLEWSAMERELDRIRHESPPTPPISP